MRYSLPHLITKEEKELCVNILIFFKHIQILSGISVNSSSVFIQGVQEKCEIKINTLAQCNK